MPCLNEAKNLPYVFSRMPAVDEVILIDGGSVDGTVDVARELHPTVTVLKQTRRGKGNALACGFVAARSDIIVTLDADGSADPAEIPRFVAALCHDVDFAKGSRFLRGGGSDDITRLRGFGNRVLTGIVNRLYGRDFTDLCYGYNAFWRYALPALGLPDPRQAVSRPGQVLNGDGFEIETLMILRAAGAGLRIAEVPSHEAHRIHGASNLNAFRDGRRVLRTILAEHRALRRRRLSEAPVSPATPSPATPAPTPNHDIPLQRGTEPSVALGET